MGGRFSAWLGWFFLISSQPLALAGALWTHKAVFRRGRKTVTTRDLGFCLAQYSIILLMCPFPPFTDT